MFNHFFFGSHRSEKAFQSFVRREGLLLVMDPPFGGLAEVLAASVKTIWDVWSKAHSDGKIYWIKWKTECLVFPKVRNNLSYSTTVDCFELYLLSLHSFCYRSQIHVQCTSTFPLQNWYAKKWRQSPHVYSVQCL